MGRGKLQAPLAHDKCVVGIRMEHAALALHIQAGRPDRQHADAPHRHVHYLYQPRPQGLRLVNVLGHC